MKELPRNYVEEVRQKLAAKMNVEEDLLDLYTALVFAKGANVTWRDVHNAWSVWMNRRDPEHKSLVPFGHLGKSVQILDAPYADAIRETALELGL